MLVFIFFFFFFQAEDGIRDAQESRGLGDVYKRQLQPRLLTRIDDPAWLVRVWKTGFGTTSGASNTHTQYDTQAPKVEAPLSDERRAVAASLEPEVISKAVRKTLRLY
eukprot:TRINITY_DN7878_c0_g2_i2.p1 TRINITY_DN7878_c0_g2~~TRINITY_DN7878_c0_g2_i2.p1  ORF type:complete len:108 (-),score=21.03 TRINITY_DN7878_c0_g2_i2:62-385(-)